MFEAFDHGFNTLVDIVGFVPSEVKNKAKLSSVLLFCDEFISLRLRFG